MTRLTLMTRTLVLLTAASCAPESKQARLIASVRLTRSSPFCAVLDGLSAGDELGSTR